MQPALFKGTLQASLLIALTASSPAVAVAAIEPPVLRLSLENEPITLDWNGYRSDVDRFLISFLMRGMLKIDGTSAKPICDLCKSFTLSSDGKTLRFDLADVEWSDGVKLEARHFVDSFERLLNPSHGFRYPEELRNIEGAIQPGKAWDPKKLGVRAYSPAQLEIRLVKPTSTLPHILTTVSTFPIRKELANAKSSSKTPQSGEAHAQEAVLGPYLLAEWSRGKRIVMEGNPKYAGARPVYRVEFILGNHAQLVERFKAGRIEILSQPTTDDVLKLKSPKLQVNPMWATRNLILNVRRKPLSERSLRRALAHALERESLPALLRNGERKATGAIPPGISGYRELPLLSADTALALKERDSAVSNGVKLAELTLLIRSNDDDRRISEWLAESLKKVGLKLKTRALPHEAYVNELEKGNFDLALSVFGFRIASPVQFLRSMRTGASGNYGGWTNVGFDALVDQLLEEQRPAEAASLLDRATQLLEVQEVALIPLGYPTQPFLLSPRVQSFATTPFGDPDLVRIEVKK